MTTVMGPHPPGTGVMYAARSAAASNSTSPTVFRFGLPFLLSTGSPFSSSTFTRLMAMSMTMAPSLIHSPLMSPATPAAATTMSASFTCDARSCVAMWQTVVVQKCAINSSAIGLPTISEWPMTTALLP